MSPPSTPTTERPGGSTKGQTALTGRNRQAIGRTGNRPPTTDEYVARILADAPALTDQQRTALAELLRPVRLTAAEWAAEDVA
jgi:hypothetical protein